MEKVLLFLLCCAEREDEAAADHVPAHLAPAVPDLLSPDKVPHCTLHHDEQRVGSTFFTMTKMTGCFFWGGGATFG